MSCDVIVFGLASEDLLADAVKRRQVLRAGGAALGLAATDAHLGIIDAGRRRCGGRAIQCGWRGTAQEEHQHERKVTRFSRSTSTSRRRISTTSTQRLAQTRWPSELPGVGWERGVPARLPEGAGRVLAGRLRLAGAGGAGSTSSPSSPPRSTGRRSTSCTCSSPEPNALPLMLIHGWPGSFVEFIDLIGPLTDPRAHGGDPADAFHVVIPSIPGHRLLHAAQRDGLDARPHRRRPSSS